MILSNLYLQFDAMYVLVIDTESVNLQWNQSMVILDEIKMVYYRFNQSNTINTSLLDQVIPLLLLLRLVIGILMQSILLYTWPGYDCASIGYHAIGIGYNSQTDIGYCCIEIGCCYVELKTRYYAIHVGCYYVEIQHTFIGAGDITFTEIEMVILLEGT
eukprot:504138_1